MDGPGGVLRNFHRQGVPGLLLVEAALGNEQQLAELGLVDGGAAVVQQQTGRWDGGQADAEVVGQVAVAVVVGDEGGQVAVQVGGGLLPGLDAGGGHHERTVHKGAKPVAVYLVGAEVDVAGEGHHHLHHVLLRPAAGRNLHVARRPVLLSYALAVEPDVEALDCPIGHAQLHGKPGFALGNADGTALGRPLTLLLNRDSLLFPMRGGRQIEGYP